jgi:hypothetical protein
MTFLGGGAWLEEAGHSLGACLTRAHLAPVSFCLALLPGCHEVSSSVIPHPSAVTLCLSTGRATEMTETFATERQNRPFLLLNCFFLCIYCNEESNAELLHTHDPFSTHLPSQTHADTHSSIGYLQN